MYVYCAMPDSGLDEPLGTEHAQFCSLAYCVCDLSGSGIVLLIKNCNLRLRACFPGIFPLRQRFLLIPFGLCVLRTCSGHVELREAVFLVGCGSGHRCWLPYWCKRSSAYVCRTIFQWLGFSSGFLLSGSMNHREALTKKCFEDADLARHR